MRIRLQAPLAALTTLLLGAAPGSGSLALRPQTSQPGLQHLRTLVASSVNVFLLSDADILRDGSLVLLDGTARTVTVAPLHGPFTTIARKGGGPGEIGLAKDLEVGPNDEIAVADVGNGRIGLWSKDGKWLGQRAVPGWVHALSWSRGRLYAKAATPGGLAIGSVDSGGSSAFHISGLLPRAMIESQPPAAWEFTPAAVALSGNGLFAHSDSVYSILEMDPAGRLVREFRRSGIERARFSDSERAVITERLRQGSAHSGRPLGSVPVFKGLIASVAVDAIGRVWVLRGSEEGKGSDLDVFSESGTYLGTVHVREQLMHVVVRRDLIVATSAGDGEEWTVEVYRVS